MPTPPKGPRLGGSPAHERHMLANLATALFDHREITTTETRAKRLQPLAERLITFGKRGDLHARRKVMRTIGDKRIVHELFTEIGPAMAERNGGYTRITKVGPRKGDNAPMAVIELIMEPVSPKQATLREAEKATERAAPDTSRAGESAAEQASEAGEDVTAADETEPADETESAEEEPSEAAEVQAEQTKAAQAEAAEQAAQQATKDTIKGGGIGPDTTRHGKRG